MTVHGDVDGVSRCSLVWPRGHRNHVPVLQNDLDEPGAERLRPLRRRIIAAADADCGLAAAAAAAALNGPPPVRARRGAATMTSCALFRQMLTRSNLSSTRTAAVSIRLGDKSTRATASATSASPPPWWGAASDAAAAGEEGVTTGMMMKVLMSMKDEVS